MYTMEKIICVMRFDVFMVEKVHMLVFMVQTHINQKQWYLSEFIIKIENNYRITSD